MAKAKTTSAESSNGKAVDAIALLKADHKAVDALFKSYEKAKGRKAEIAQKICMELLIHMALEEEIFYPACKDAVDDDDLDEAYVEHDGAKVLMAEIESGSPKDPFYDAKVKVLSEDIKHHVKEEEEPGGVFAQAKKSGVDMKALGAKMQARKEELVAQMKGKTLPAPITRTMTGAKVEHGSVQA